MRLRGSAVTDHGSGALAADIGLFCVFAMSFCSYLCLLLLFRRNLCGVGVVCANVVLLFERLIPGGPSCVGDVDDDLYVCVYVFCV